MRSPEALLEVLRGEGPDLLVTGALYADALVADRRFVVSALRAWDDIELLRIERNHAASD